MTGEYGGGKQTFCWRRGSERVGGDAVNMISLHMQGGCLCENMPGLRHDVNNVEIAATIAPRPLLMVSATGDWTAETMEREFPAVRSAYALFNAAPKVHAVKFTAEHNYNKDSREAMYAWMARWMQNAPADVRRPERGFSVDSLADLMVFHGRALPAGAVTPAELTARWIASATAQPAATASHSRRRFVTRSASAKRPRGSRSREAGSPRRRRRGATPEVDAALRQAGSRSVPSGSRRSTRRRRRSAPLRHLQPHRRQPTGRRHRRALRQSPSAVLVADGDAALPALLAAAIVPARLTVANVGGFDTSSDDAFLQRIDIAGLRRAGDFQTAAGMATGDVIVPARATRSRCRDSHRAPGTDRGRSSR